MNKKITKSQYLQLIGLSELAKHYDTLLTSIQKSVAEIMDEKIEHSGDGWSGELVFTNRELDEVLRLAKIEVEDEQQ